jgi:predicted Rossmann fold flavoprotein
MSDLLVVGGGAAGLAAAWASSRLGLEVTVLERTERCGKKLAIAGGGKCNLSHAASPRELAARFDADPKLLVPLFRRFPFQRIEKLFGLAGVRCRTDEDGCIWPQGMTGPEVRDELTRQAEARGAVFRTGARVTGFERSANGWQVFCGGEVLAASNVLLATGGASYPQTGSTGDGIALCRELGLECRDWFPALCSLEPDRDISHLAGNTRQNVRMRLEVEGSPAREKQGHFLFTGQYLSGSAVLNLSGHAARGLADGRRVELVVDWVPETDDAGLRAELLAPGRKRVVNVLAPVLSRRFALDLLECSGIPVERTTSELSRQERERVVRELKQTRFRVTGTEPLERATVSGGGLCLDEVELATGRVRRFDGLHAAGELLDTWAETGGYNLHFCWATGFAVAEALAGKELK